MIMKKNVLHFLLLVSLLASACAVQKPTGIVLQAKSSILDKPEFAPAHVGISIYDPAEKKYLYNYQEAKYFVPASNTK